MSVDDLYTLPEDGLKYELQAGMVVSEPLPGTRHGYVAARVAELLSVHVRRHRLGVVLAGDSGFILSRSPDTVRGPDVAFVSRRRFEELKDPTRAFPGAPDLAVEVLSPSNTLASMHAKVADYLAAGTRLVWVIDTEREMVAVYRSLLSPRTLGAEEGVLDGEDVVGLPGEGRGAVPDLSISTTGFDPLDPRARGCRSIGLVETPAAPPGPFGTAWPRDGSGQ